MSKVNNMRLAHVSWPACVDRIIEIWHNIISVKSKHRMWYGESDLLGLTRPSDEFQLQLLNEWAKVETGIFFSINEYTVENQSKKCQTNRSESKGPGWRVGL